MDHENQNDAPFCARPFRHAIAEADGAFRTCPASWLPEDLGDWREASPEALWNGAGAQALRQSILDGSYRYCAALACPYLAPGGPSLPAKDAVENVLIRRVLSEGLATMPWGPDVVELDLRASAPSGDAIAALLGPDILRDATLLVLRLDPSSLADEGIVAALKRLPLSSMLSLHIATEIALEAFTPETWRLPAKLPIRRPKW